MNNKNKKNIMLYSLIAIVFFATIGITYAYFYVTVSGNEDAKDIVTTTGNLELKYVDGEAITATEIFPGWSTSKTITIENIGSLDAYYNIYWKELTNTITNNELIIEATCTNYEFYGTPNQANRGNCDPIESHPVPAIASTIVDNVGISVGYTQVYVFTFSFVETNSNQNYNQDAVFNGIINVGDSLGRYNLNGQLLDALSNPIANATISLHSEPMTTITDSDGKFTFENVLEGNHTINIISGENTLVDSDSLMLNTSKEVGAKDKLISSNIQNKTINLTIVLGSNNKVGEYRATPTVSNNGPRTLANYLMTNSATLGITAIEEEATELQEYATTDYRYQGGGYCSGVQMTQEICNEICLGNSCFVESFGISESGDCNDEEYYYNGQITEDFNETDCLRYGGTIVGTEPNNYISFNGEVWRIVGVFKTKSNVTDSKPEYRVKIIRDKPISFLTWDEHNNDEVNHVKSWPYSSVQKMLNSGAYYNRLGASIEDYQIKYQNDNSYRLYNDCGANVECDYTTIGLLNGYKDMIDDVVWYLGNVSEGLSAGVYYTRERTATDNINETYGYPASPSSWMGKLGFMYSSDMEYANSNNECRESNTALDCYKTNWMSNSLAFWTISNYSDYEVSFTLMGKTHYRFDSAEYYRYGVVPTLYLKPDVILSGGDGTLQSMYTIEPSIN